MARRLIRLPGRKKQTPSETEAARRRADQRFQAAGIVSGRKHEASMAETSRKHAASMASSSQESQRRLAEIGGKERRDIAMIARGMKPTAATGTAAGGKTKPGAIDLSLIHI